MPSVPKNIHQFNVAALAVFDLLYASFPQPVEIDAANLAIFAAPDETSTKDLWDQAMVADHVVTWLAEEGFLRYTNQTSDRFFGVRLTLRGLTVLGYVPLSLKEGGRKSPAIQAVRRVLAAGAEKASVSAAESIVSALFRASLEYGVSAVSRGGLVA